MLFCHVRRTTEIIPALLPRSRFYAFSLYSEDMKTSFGLTDGQVDLIATFGNLGGNVGVHVGVLYKR